MITFIRIVGLWFLGIWYSLMALYLLLILYIAKFSSRPWRPKDHSNVPEVLLDHQLGVHKYAKVNVSIPFDVHLIDRFSIYRYGF